jgi:hypothetical protein
MTIEKLTLRKITACPVVLPLERPVVARIATMEQWPLVLIDLETEEGVTGRSYLEPYLVKALRYLVPCIADLSELLWIGSINHLICNSARLRELPGETFHCGHYASFGRQHMQELIDRYRKDR